MTSSSVRRAVPTPLIVVIAGLTLVGVVALVAGAIGRALVRQAYAGTSLPVLNGMIQGRAAHEVSYYLAALDSLLRGGFYAACGVVLAFAMLTNVRVRRTIDRWLGPAPPGSGAADVTRRVPARRVLVLLAAFVVVQGTAVATQAELWPFSPYAMYSDVVGNPFRFMHVVAVTDSGEVRLDAARELPPFDAVRLLFSLERLLASRDTVALERAFVSLEGLYDRAQREHRHQLGPLRGMRLYRVEVTLDPRLRNLDRPDRRILLAEHVTAR